jgi:hypothetical protein
MQLYDRCNYVHKERHNGRNHSNVFFRELDHRDSDGSDRVLCFHYRFQDVEIQKRKRGVICAL